MKAREYNRLVNLLQNSSAKDLYEAFASLDKGSKLTPLWKDLKGTILTHYTPPRNLAVFKYPKSDNSGFEIRTLVIEKEDPKYIEGEDYYRQGEYRKFLKNKIDGNISYFNEIK